MASKKTALFLIACLLMIPLVVSCGGKKKAPPPTPTQKETPRETVAPVPEEKPAEAPAAYEFVDINFDFDKHDLKPGAQKILAQHAKVLSENKGWRVRIEGHCDERGTVEYNLGLGERRANAAKNYLVQYGVDAANITTVTYGKERPKDRRSNEEGWAINRRAEFHVTK